MQKPKPTDLPRPRPADPINEKAVARMIEGAAWPDDYEFRALKRAAGTLDPDRPGKRRPSL